MGRYRSVVIAVASALMVLLTDGAVAAAQDIPLLDDPLNCAQAQEPFDGPQPVAADDTSTVQLSTGCFLVVGLDLEAGESVGFTYLSGQFDSLNIAFYLPGAVPGASFHDPANVRLGVPSVRGTVPGTGTVPVIVAIQGVGGPNLGTAAVRIDTGTVVATTTTTSTTTTTIATTTTTTTTIATTTTVAETTTTVSETTAAPSTTAVPTTVDTTVADDAAENGESEAPSEASEASDALAPDEDGATATEPATVQPNDGLPLWLVLVTVGAAMLAIGWLLTRIRASRTPRTPAPWERPVIAWTLQHAAPTGSCSTNGRAIVNPDDDGSLDTYGVAELFAVPSSGKRSRTVVGDPLLAQLETLYAGRGNGEELRSAVDAFVNTLTRHLDGKKVPVDAALLVELRQENAALIGDTYACTDGSWTHFERWQEIPQVENPAQHDIVQVAVLGRPGATGSEWADRNADLTEAFAALIEDRRAPRGLWVFD